MRRSAVGGVVTNLSLFFGRSIVGTKDFQDLTQQQCGEIPVR